MQIPMLARNRVLTLEELAEKVRALQADRLRVAHCHGCFDIVHFGHVRHLEAAKELADILIVTVTQDKYVNKGPNRPVFPEQQRAEVLAGLKAVDFSAVNRWPSAVETIEFLRPDLFIKGQEYETRAMEVNPNFLAEKEAVKRVGGQIAFTHEETSSSTAAVKRIRAA